MRSNKYHGWQQVFRFSFRQGIKQKAYKIMLLCMCLVMIVGMPVMTIIQKNGDEKETDSKINKVMIFDESGLTIDFSNALKDKRYQNVVVDASPEIGYEEQVKKLKESKDSSDIVMRLQSTADGQFNLLVVKSADTALTDTDIDKASEDIKEYFCKEKLVLANMTKEQEAFIKQSVESTVRFVSDNGQIVEEEEKDKGITTNEYTMMVAGITLITMIISISGNSIATSIVTEKSTRVIEYLIINIKPMALLIGKILSALLLVTIQFLCMGCSYLLATVLNRAILGEKAKSISDMFNGITDCLSGVNPENVILAVAFIFIGILFFSIIAGLAGASVSKIEEMTEGMKLFQITMMAGGYLSMGLCIAEMLGKTSQIFRNICTLLPMSSPFVVPASLLIGRTSTLLGLVSIIILIAITAMLFSFTAKVYESMILYQGKQLKVRNIIQMAKDRPAVEKEEA